MPVAVIVRPDVLWSRSRAADLLDEAERLNEMLREAEKTPRRPVASVLNTRRN